MEDNIYKIHLDDIPSEMANVNYTDDDMVIIDGIKDVCQIESVKLGFNVFMVCYEGRLQVNVNGKMVSVSKNQLLIYPSSVVVDDVMVSPDLNCKILCITDKLLRTLLHPFTDVWNKAMYQKKENIFNLENTDNDVLKGNLLFELLTIYMKEENKIFRSEIIHSLLQTVLLDFVSHYQFYCSDVEYSKSPSIGTGLFNRFIDLLNRSERKRRSVNHYAAELCVSPKYLSRVCKEESDKTALEWIQNYVNDDITHLLKSSDLSIKEIADRTGFPDMSSFGKYVRRTFGASPRMYRNK